MSMGSESRGESLRAFSKGNMVRHETSILTAISSRWRRKPGLPLPAESICLTHAAAKSRGIRRNNPQKIFSLEFSEYLLCYRREYENSIVISFCTFRNDQRSRPDFSPIGDIELAVVIIHAADFFKKQVAAGLVGQYGFYDICCSIDHPDDVVLRIAYENIIFFIYR